MTEDERELFGVKAKTTAKYIQRHLINGSRNPDPDTISNILAACDGYFTKEELILFFIARKVKVA